MGLLLRAGAAFDEAGLPVEHAKVLIDRGSLLLGLGAFDEADAQLLQAIAAGAEPPERAFAVLLRARVARRRGDLAAARDLADESVRALTAVGRRGLLPEAWNEAAEVERAAGRFDEAERLYRRALEGFVLLGSEAALTAELNLGLTLVELGDWEPAMASLEGALASMRSRGELARADSWQLALAWACARAERWPEAHHHVASARPSEEPEWRRLCARFAAWCRQRGRGELVPGWAADPSP